MRKEIRQKLTDCEVYVASDGREFNDRKACEIHEGIVNGTIKICSACNGEGRTSEWQEYENYHTGVLEKSLVFPTCKTCNGKGYLEKKIVWQ